MPEDTVIAGSLQQTQNPQENHGRGFAKYLLILIAILALIWAVNSGYFSGAQKENRNAADSGSGETAGQNAGASAGALAERASDVLIYNEAIDKKDKKLCERVIDVSLKTDCAKFFAINGF